VTIARLDGSSPRKATVSAQSVYPATSQQLARTSATHAHLASTARRLHSVTASTVTLATTLTRRLP